MVWYSHLSACSLTFVISVLCVCVCVFSLDDSYSEVSKEIPLCDFDLHLPDD